MAVRRKTTADKQEITNNKKTENSYDYYAS